MATQSKNTGLPEFFTDTRSADNVRRQFLEAPMEAAGQAALGSAIELATLMSMLPGAFVASQRRELNRVLKSGDKNDSRVAALQTSIEQAEVLQTTARLGQARVQRALVALADNDDVFHGFVSDADFAPLKGLTVRLTDSEAPRGKALSATTDDDGYFSISLGAKGDTPPDPKASPTSFSQRITDLLASLGREPNAAPAANAEAVASQVEILKNRKLLYSDPVLIARDRGSIYREYVIGDSEPSSASDFRDFISKLSHKPTSPQVDLTRVSAEASQAGPSAAPPSGKKKSPPRAKSPKPRSKKRR